MFLSGANSLYAMSKGDHPVNNSLFMDGGGAAGSVSHKEARYDRQLRLWGDDGQNRLEASHVCLLNATVVGCEILKSLVLPGIARFTIVDPGFVTEESAGSNFFLDRAAIGQGRAKNACEMLKELNPDVEGDYIAESPDQLLTEDRIDQFTLVIGTGLTEKTTLGFAQYLWDRSVPFIVCKTYGLMGYLRISVRDHTIVEAHPENPFEDFRLYRPFPELLECVDSFDLDTMDHQKHSHTPYLVLLVKALQSWRQQKASACVYPETRTDRNEIKTILLGMRQPDDKGRIDEENFQEAVDMLNRAFHKSEQVPPELAQILAHRNCGESSAHFWVLCAAVREFTAKNNGTLPVRGTLPDMISDSESYIRLQTVYRNRALADAELVHEIAARLCRQLGGGGHEPTLKECRLFCRNAAFIRHIGGRSVEEEVNEQRNGAKAHPVATATQAAFESGDKMFSWYLLLRSAERFRMQKGRYPGTNGVPIDLDMTDLKQRLITLLTDQLKMPEQSVGYVDDGFIEEMCRYGASEIHPVASFVGGVAAQEAIKVITNQYVPLQNTLIYDGHTGNAATYSL